MTVFEKLVLSALSLIMKITYRHMRRNFNDGELHELVTEWDERNNGTISSHFNLDGIFTLVPMEDADLNNLYIDEDGSFNPFDIDRYSMGRVICKDIHLMFRTGSGTEPLTEAYFINMKTGQRQGIELNIKEGK